MTSTSAGNGSFPVVASPGDYPRRSRPDGSASWRLPQVQALVQRFSGDGAHDMPVSKRRTPSPPRADMVVYSLGTTQHPETGIAVHRRVRACRGASLTSMSTSASSPGSAATFSTGATSHRSGSSGSATSYQDCSSRDASTGDFYARYPPAQTNAAPGGGSEWQFHPVAAATSTMAPPPQWSHTVPGGPGGGGGDGGYYGGTDAMNFHIPSAFAPQPGPAGECYEPEYDLYPMPAVQPVLARPTGAPPPARPAPNRPAQFQQQQEQQRLSEGNLAAQAQPRPGAKEKTKPAGTVHNDNFVNHYETRMCTHFMGTGDCPFDEDCRYAHGHDDKRTYAANVRDGITSVEALREFLQRRKAPAIMQGNWAY